MSMCIIFRKDSTTCVINADTSEKVSLYSKKTEWERKNDRRLTVHFGIKPLILMIIKRYHNNINIVLKDISLKRRRWHLLLKDADNDNNYLWEGGMFWYCSNALFKLPLNIFIIKMKKKSSSALTYEFLKITFCNN